MKERISNKIHIKYYEERKRFLLFAVGILLLLFLAFYILNRSFASYESNARLNAGIDQALYIFGTDEIDFNLDPEQIVPSDDPYVYKFSIQNYDDEKDTDVDIEYTVDLRTTTNLPITIKLYRNENYDAAGANNLLGDPVIKQDEDSAYYRTYNQLGAYDMPYTARTKDIYTIVINYPKSFSDYEVYADYIEDIEITIKSKQVI